MDVENMVKMSNDIACFFGSESDTALAAKGVADHIVKFWEPRMRQAILEHYRNGGTGFSELSKSAMALLAEKQ
jgi:formate dehydrogenase subunit delta